MSASGRVLRIEKLSSFDGDGLRTVVFLKGCPLRCQWCSTPESHEKQTDFGNNKKKCTGCFDCVNVCPEKAIAYDIKKEQFTTDMDRCTDCRKCIDVCPEGSRIAWGYTADVDDIFKKITGVGNSLILENLKKIDACPPKLSHHCPDAGHPHCE